ncbi:MULTISPECIES: hypothetical protein [unclassified Pantoea]|uniref:hypothetical protein n=1 Tax=unclassified Pantoea TaxID=2630326 RepID=UPI001232794E|nr:MULTISPECIES: hypothetical protein [unclassified Pantoea]KAA6093893.1 hypothetical protein F3I21_22420 [Pantoea sp. B_9]KAA6106534.1 hypothetical protein F3I18_23355 [Pantoea sp. B_10]
MRSLTTGVALFFVGALLMASTGYAGVNSDNVIQQVINALMDEKNPFYHIAWLGFILTLTGSILLLYWMLFGGVKKAERSR